MALKFKIFPRRESPGFLIYQAATRMKAELHRAFQVHGINATPEQWTVLSSLWESDNVHQSLLAERTGKDRHNITRILNLLEDSGLVRRLPDYEDRRCQRVCLTKAGRALKPKLVDVTTEFLDQALSGLTQGDLHSMTRILSRIIENLARDSKDSEVSGALRRGCEAHMTKRRVIGKPIGGAVRDYETKTSPTGS
jgi:DNA-binding MarR family transcriptional regulator